MDQLGALVGWFKTPWVIALVVGVIMYYLNSQCFITKTNMKDKLPINSQRLSALKNAVYLMAILSVILYAYKFVEDPMEKQYQYMKGLPPF
jgi:hypothetical protein